MTFNAEGGIIQSYKLWYDNFQWLIVGSLLVAKRPLENYGSLARSENKLSFRGVNNMSTLSKSTKVFVNVQGTQHSLNAADTMVYDHGTNTVKWHPPTEWTDM